MVLEGYGKNIISFLLPIMHQTDKYILAMITQHISIN